MRSLLSLSVSLSILGTCFAQATSSEALTKDILFRNGVFYPEHSVAGKYFYNGTWYDGAEDVTGPNAAWRTTPEQIAYAAGYPDIETLAKSWGYYLPGTEDLAALANQHGYNSLEDMALSWGYFDYNSGTPNYTNLANWNGYASLEDMAVAQGAIVPGTGEPYYDMLAWNWGYPDMESAAAAYNFYVDGSGTISPAMAAEWGYPSLQAWADAEAGGNLTTLANQYGYNSMTDFAVNYGYLTDGTPDPQKFAEYNGYANLDDMAYAYNAVSNGTPDVNLLANNNGYSTPEQWARSWGAIDNPTPDVIALSNAMGYSDPASWALANGHAQGDPTAMFNTYGGIESFAQSNGFAIEKPALTDIQKGSILDAIQKGTLNSTDINNMLTSTNGSGAANLFTKPDGTVDTNYIADMLAVAQDKGDLDTISQTYLAAAKSAAAHPDQVGDIDFSGWTEIPNLNNFPVNESNLSWDQINNAEGFNYSNFSGMDMSDFVPNGTNGAYNGSDFSNTNLTGSQLNAMGNSIYSLNLAGTNLTGFTAAGKTIQYTTLTGATGITGASLAGVNGIYGTNLGTTNMAGFTTANGATLYQTDFSATTNFSAASLNTASSLNFSNFTGKSMTGFNPTGKSLYGTNLTNTTGLTAASLKTASNLQYVKLTGTGITRTQLAAQGVSNSVLNTITF